LKVLHVVPALGPAYGGPSTVVPELAHALARHGIKVDIATTDANGRECLNVPKGIAVTKDGVDTYYFRRHWPRSYTCSFPLASWLRRRADDYDLIHVSAVFSFPSLAATRWTGRPVIVWPHGMLDSWALRQKAWKKQLYLRILERPALRRARALHALTHSEARQLGTLKLVTPRFVVPNGVDSNMYRALPPRDTLSRRYPQLRGRSVVLFLGRLDPKKGLDLLVPAFARIVSQGHLTPTPFLVIAGPDLIGYRRSLELLVNRAGIDDHVLFTGMLSGLEKLAALAAADVFALPSRSEGLPVALLEALASGCPVIATDACNVSEIHEAGVGLRTGANVSDLEAALRTLLGDLGLAKEMGERGREYVQERFSWSKIAGDMVRIYTDITRDTRQSSSWVSDV
jgi:glycosyltransferase involved in cell wall biosynthesis